MFIITKNIGKFRPDRVLRKIYDTGKACKKYHSPLTFNYYIFLISFIRCYMREGYSAEEVNRWGLGTSFKAAKKMTKFISLQKMREIDDKLNPKSWRVLVNDKGVFSQTCNLLKLPCPQLYAILFENQTGFSYRNSSLLKKNEIVEFIRDELPNEFVIKPSGGWGGESIYIYTKTNNGIVDGFGDLRSEQDIYDNIVYSKYSSYIIQERLRNHSELMKLFPSNNLHTVRIISLIASSGQCKILHAHLNVATDKNIASQLSDLKISISLIDGSLEYGIVIDKINGGFRKIPANSTAERPFDELKIPFWKEVLTLVEEASLKFLPLRTLGWDIGITEKGVIILETNIKYTPPNYFNTINGFKNSLFSNI